MNRKRERRILISDMSLRIHRLLSYFRARAKGAQVTRQAPEDNAHSIVPSPDVRASFEEDGVVFLHLRSGIVFRSNRVGAAIWKGLGRRQDLAAIASEIGREYGIPADRAARDAAAFVAQIEAQGFLARHAGA